MKRCILFILLLVTFFIVMGCKESLSIKKSSSSFIILIDTSRSPRQSDFEIWKEKMGIIIDEFREGMICIAPITSDFPNSSRCEIIKKVWPPPSIFSTPDDENERKKRLLVEYINDLQQDALRTDIRSAVFYALDILQRKSPPKYLYIYSDFLQTVQVNLPPTINAQGVQVKMMFSAPNEEYRGGRTVVDIYNGVETYWEEIFRQWGAENAEMVMIAP